MAEPLAADRGPRESRAITRIACDRFFKQLQRFDYSLTGKTVVDLYRPQIEIVGCQIASWAPHCAADLGGFQGWLDDPGDACRHLILKIEDILQRAVEPICPQMGGLLGVDQLRGDAQPTAARSDRAFEQVTHAQFAADPLYVDRLTFVREARISRDYEEPANPA